MSPDPLDIIWRSADSPAPTFTADDMDGVPPETVARLTLLGILRQAAPATHVMCDGCDGGHIERVISLPYPDGQTRFFIRCPENGRIEVPRDRLMQWSVDYTPLLLVLTKALAVQGTLDEIVPNRIWSLGRASLAGKSKTVWAARGLAWPDAVRIAASLPKGRSPILFHLGRPADDGLLDMPRESIIDLRTVLRIDADLAVDVYAIERQLGDVAPSPSRQQPKKQSRRDATVGALKRELHQRILSFKSAIRHADDIGRTFDVPPLTQKELAEAIGESESAVSRAIARSKDLELKVMLQTVKSHNMIRKYSR